MNSLLRCSPILITVFVLSAAFAECGQAQGAAPIAAPAARSAQPPRQPPRQLPGKQRTARINVNAGSAIRINYGNPSWNKASEAIDTATVIMREGVSGRIVQVQLIETAPDSSLFSGRYSINWQNMEQLQTEFYIPSQTQLAEKDGLMKVAAKITAGEMIRNPFIMRKSPNGEQSIEIFDTKEQARTAMKAYRAEQLVMMQNQRPTKFPSDQDLDTEKVAAEQKAREDAAHAVSDRARLEQLEAKRLSDLIAQQAAMSQQEKQSKQKQAAELAREGLQLFKAEDYKAARSKFDQAVTLDPDNRVFYFQYGVSLYKTDDYNRSVVLLEMANGPDVNRTEKNYFLALDHMKLGETDAAIKSFDDVIGSHDPVMGPSAQFYKGVLLFEHESYDLAQKSFQAVLDTSNDPLLDERADAYIEQILRSRQLNEERKHKWTLSAALGEMYDSNVILASDSQRDAGNATNAAGWRSLFSGSARYRPVYETDHELAVQLDLVSLYTLTQNLKFDQTLRNADPTVVTLTLPWTHKGTWFDKGHKLDIIPGYETTIMSLENNTSKSILNSYLLGISNLLVMSESWFSTTVLDLRLDQSNLTPATADDDATAVKVRVSNTNLLFLGEKKDRFLIPEGALTLNQAIGRSAAYQRADIAIGYLLPWKWETTANFKLGYYFLDYPQKLPERTDNSYTLTAGLSRKLSSIWNVGLLGSYNINRSNETANTYNKFTTLLTFSAAYGL